MHDQLRRLNVHRSPFVRLVVGDSIVITTEVSEAHLQPRSWLLYGLNCSLRFNRLQLFAIRHLLASKLHDRDLVNEARVTLLVTSLV